MRDRIVVGVDGSDGARVALEWAVEEARLRQLLRAGLDSFHQLGVDCRGGTSA